MDPKNEHAPEKKTGTEKVREESEKKEHQYGYVQPRTDRDTPGVDADDERTSADAANGPN